jgi:hypothetical protein
MRRHSAAFTFVEIATVIVIVALMVGGIMAGKSLLRGAQLRAFATDAQRYGTAVKNFRDQYGGMPGDLPNATKYWGALDATHSNCVGIAASVGSTATCDGNGNGRVSDDPTGGDDMNERFRFWQHLANAEMVSGSFTGVKDSSATNSTAPGSNIPASRIDKVSGYNAMSETDGTLLSGTYFGTNPPINIFMMGAQVTGADNSGVNLTPTDANYLDDKMDDGKPGSGALQSFKNGGAIAPSCTTTTSPQTAVYNRQQRDKLCVVYYFFAK